MASSNSLKPLAACALACASACTQAATIIVPRDQPTIQRAIDAAQPGDEVLVSPGFYAEALVIDKSLTLASKLGSKRTWLLRTGNTSVTLRLASGDHVTLRGFTTEEGQSVGGGAAVDARGGTVTLEDDEFKASMEMGEGAAILQVGGALLMRHDRVIASDVGARGAAVRLLSTHGSYLFDNTTAGTRGSGVHIDGGTRIRLVRNSIRLSSGADLGGGLRIDGNAQIFAGGNLITHNSARSGGGVAIAFTDTAPQSDFASNTIADNSADTGKGHAIYMTGQLGLLVFANNIFDAVTAGGDTVYCRDEGDTSPAFGWNDVWSPNAKIATDSCSDITTGSNLGADPQFDTSNPSVLYRLAPDSPLIDAGANAASVRLHLDLTGHPRVMNGGHADVIDIGAYEFHPK